MLMYRNSIYNFFNNCSKQKSKKNPTKLFQKNKRNMRCHFDFIGVCPIFHYFFWNSRRAWFYNDQIKSSRVEYLQNYTSNFINCISLSINIYLAGSLFRSITLTLANYYTTWNEPNLAFGACLFLFLPKTIRYKEN